ncbi:MAG: NADH:flavin oxidoreductase [Desulfobacterales bacterium]|nr:NADH:flavin oxidoreductase [Desulfobacterales bacterium]
MPILFEKTRINSLALKNRFVRSATWEGMAHKDGACSRRLIDLMAELARGGVGLIISSHAFVLPQGQASPWQVGAYGDELLPGLTRLAQAVHDNGGKILLQLAHAGCHADTELTGQPPMGPSALNNDPGESCREMNVAEIDQTVIAFGRAAARAKRAGFDGVQIHAAHGYLLSQFLSPFYNKRTDHYGGSIANRSRIVLDVLKSIRNQTDNHFPVMIKMNSEDYLETGLTMSEMLQTAKRLQQAGIDAVELSGGTKFSGKLNPIRSGKINPENEAFYKEAAGAFKESISVPLLLVGGIRSYGVAQGLVEAGLADYISLCRPLIREPGLVKRWQSGDTGKSMCRSDNLCFRPAREGKGIYCVRSEKEQQHEIL